MLRTKWRFGFATEAMNWMCQNLAHHSVPNFHHPLTIMQLSKLPMQPFSVYGSSTFRCSKLATPYIKINFKNLHHPHVPPQLGFTDTQLIKYLYCTVQYLSLSSASTSQIDVLAGMASTTTNSFPSFPELCSTAHCYLPELYSEVLSCLQTTLTYYTKGNRKSRPYN